MEGFVPGASVFFVEATLEPLAANIPKHSLTPYFAALTVEEWAANSTSAHDFSYDIWTAGEAKDATAPRLWSSMVAGIATSGKGGLDDWKAVNKYLRGSPKRGIGSGSRSSYCS